MILITGASSGIGEACARLFAREGRELALVARRAGRLARLARELGRSRIECHRIDVSSRREVEAFARKRAKLLSKVDVLINCAGLARGFDPLQDGKPADWDEMIDTNVKGLLAMTRAALPGMIRRDRGHIVNLGSVAGRWVYPRGNVYCASKAAVHALSESLRIDLSGTSIRVTEISPGMVNTEFSQVRFRDRRRAEQVYAGMSPLTAMDVAETIVWCVNRPAHVNIQEMVIFPTAQAAATVVSRRGFPSPRAGTR